MARFLITYLGGDPPSTPEEGKNHQEKWKAWLAELGAAAVSPANPLKGTVTVNPDGSTQGGTTGMMGYTIVEAASMEEATDIARKCPFNGKLEVSEMMTMPG